MVKVTLGLIEAWVMSAPLVVVEKNDPAENDLDSANYTRKRPRDIVLAVADARVAPVAGL